MLFFRPDFGYDVGRELEVILFKIGVAVLPRVMEFMIKSLIGRHSMQLQRHQRRTNNLAIQLDKSQVQGGGVEGHLI